MSFNRETIPSVAATIPTDIPEPSRPDQWKAPTSWDLQDFDKLLKHAFSIACILGTVVKEKQVEEFQDGALAEERLKDLAATPKTWNLLTKPLEDINLALKQAMIEEVCHPLDVFQRSIDNKETTIHQSIIRGIEQIQDDHVNNIRDELEVFFFATIPEALKQVKLAIFLQLLRRKMWRLNTLSRTDPGKLNEECSLLSVQLEEGNEDEASQFENAFEQLTAKECQTVASDIEQLAREYNRKTREKRRAQSLGPSFAELFVLEAIQFTARHLRKQSLEIEGPGDRGDLDVSVITQSLLPVETAPPSQVEVLTRCASVLEIAETRLRARQVPEEGSVQSREDLAEVFEAFPHVFLPLLKKGLGDDISGYGASTELQSSITNTTSTAATGDNVTD